ncbi:MAG: ATP-binding protein [Pseudomonadota bacterium]|jgi:two-component system NtrC family sensor kinase
MEPAADANAEIESDVLLDALSQHVLLLDRDGVILRGNAAWARFARLRGSGPDAWMGADFVEVVGRMAGLPPPRSDSLRDGLAALKAGRGGFSTDVCYSAPNLTQWFSVDAHALEDGRRIVVQHDVTELRIFDHARIRFEQMVDASSDAILVVDGDGNVGYANDAACRLAGALPREGASAVASLIDRTAIAIAAASGAWRSEITIRTLDGADIPVVQDVRRHESPDDGGAYFTVMLHDISAEQSREEELQNRNVELQLAYSQLRGAQDQLLQSEKMASLGQLAAGVAHEINNPIGYVHSNIGTLKDYTRSLFGMLAACENALASAMLPPDQRAALDEQRDRFEIDYLTQDLPSLLDESAEGIERVRKIVQDLKDFSHAGQGDEWQIADLHRGLDSTLNIVWNELKYKAEVVKDYGPLPPVECIPSQINQVFLNILVNAGHAIKERGTIRISSGASEDTGWIEIADSGEGIPEENLQRIFDPFFTTKRVGQGTGLGLSLSYSIIKKHGGRIEVSSTLGQGTAFRILLPLRQPETRAP